MRDENKIDYIELPARDLDRIEEFYRKCFGWSFADYGPDYRAFNDGRLDGGFYRAECEAEQASGSALVVFFANDLEATRERIVENGATLSVDIFSFPGGRRFHFKDPNGNELAVWSDK